MQYSAGINMHKAKRLVALAILVLSLLVSYALVTHAQTSAGSAGAGENANQATAGAGVSTGGTAGITFPVPELGNCTNKDACRAYCDDGTHVDVCVVFAQAHGLMNKKEADRATSFSKSIRGGGGPGGCTSPRDCEAFCSSLANIEVCVKFAEDHGASGREIEMGRKVSGFLKSGGTMPGGCTSKDSCMAYCSDFSHAEECAAFAKKAGITQISGEGAPPEKLLELMKSGQTPGGCNSKETCEAYCKDGAHQNECIAFAEKAGFTNHGDAEKLRQGNFTGPGGCKSQEECSAYCNDQAHHDECYKFAEEHGFLNKDEIQRVKQGVVSLKAGIEHASPEVAACIKSILGETAIEDIQSGKLAPGPEVGDQMRGCFEKFGKKFNAQESFKRLPPEVLACVKAKLGDAFDKMQSGEAQPTADMGDTLRVCFQAMELKQGGPEGNQQGQRGGPGMGGGGPQDVGGFLRSAPPEIVACLKEKLGDRYDAIQSHTTKDIGAETGALMRSCFQSFHPPEHTFNQQSGEFDVHRQEMQQGEQGGNMNQDQGMHQQNMQSGGQSLPPEIADCVKASGISLDTREAGNRQEVKDAISACFQKARTQIQNGASSTGAPGPGMNMMPGQGYPTSGQYGQQGNPSNYGSNGYPTSSYPGNYQGRPGGGGAPYGSSTTGGQYPPQYQNQPSSSGSYQYQPPSAGSPPPSSSSYNSNPSASCAQYGGTWNGSTCVMPNSPPPQTPPGNFIQGPSPSRAYNRSLSSLSRWKPPAFAKILPSRSLRPQTD